MQHLHREGSAYNQVVPGRPRVTNAVLSDIVLQKVREIEYMEKTVVREDGEETVYPYHESVSGSPIFLLHVRGGADASGYIRGKRQACSFQMLRQRRSVSFRRFRLSVVPPFVRYLRREQRIRHTRVLRRDSHLEHNTRRGRRNIVSDLPSGISVDRFSDQSRRVALRIYRETDQSKDHRSIEDPTNAVGFRQILVVWKVRRFALEYPSKLYRFIGVESKV